MTIRSVGEWFSAIQSGDRDLVAAALPTYQGSTDRNGETGLMHAARSGDVHMVEMLIDEAGATNIEGLTALMIAAQSNSREICSVLVLEEKERLKATPGSEKTALMVAAQFGSTEAARALMPYQKGRTDARGRTALMYAAEAGHVDIAQALLDREKGIISQDSKTALILATENNHQYVIKLLTPYESMLLPDITRQSFLNFSRSDQTSVELSIQLIDVLRDTDDPVTPAKTILEQELEMKIRQLELRVASLHDQSSSILGENIQLQRAKQSLGDMVGVLRNQIENLTAETTDKDSIIQDLMKRISDLRKGGPSAVQRAADSGELSNYENVPVIRNALGEGNDPRKEAAITRLLDLLGRASAICAPLSAVKSAEDVVSNDLGRLQQEIEDSVAAARAKDDTIRRLRDELETLRRNVLEGTAAVAPDTANLIKERNDLFDKLRALQQENDSLKASLSQARQRIVDQDDALAHLRQQLTDAADAARTRENRLESRIAALQRQIAEKDNSLAQQRADAEAALADLRQRLSASEETVEKLTRLIEGKEEQLHGARMGVVPFAAGAKDGDAYQEALQEELASLREVICAKEDELGNLRVELDAREREVSDLRDALESMPTAPTFLGTESGDLQAGELTRAKQEIRELQANLEAKESVIANVRAELAKRTATDDANVVAQFLEQQARMDDLTANLARANRELAEARGRENDVQDLRNTLAQTEAELAKTAEELASRDVEIRRLQGELETAGAGAGDDLKGQLSAQSAELADLRLGLETKERLIQDLRTQLENQPTTSTIYNEETADLIDAAAFRELQTENKNLGDELESARTALDKLKADVRSREHAVADLETKLRNAETKAESATKANRQLTDQLKEKDAQIERLDAELKDRPAGVPPETIQLLTNTLEEVQLELEASKKEIERLKDKLDDREGHLTRLRTESARRERDLEEYRQALEASQPDGAEPIIEPEALRKLEQEVAGLRRDLGSKEMALEQTRAELKDRQEEARQHAEAVKYYKQLVDDIQSGIVTLDENLKSVYPPV
ncbi:Axoneme-associated protein [Giardia muris]|uniref:Axoneme-associated protein n=1 Tax=Giardia muris TaxID=5742 RepID=A0A4Z1SYG0_GIAMU|nr:Axoneme-associated protein [Giardia muris]|eukprot:TNJ26703.1 Axoneme-associated protein [Giardia muris]